MNPIRIGIGLVLPKPQRYIWVRKQFEVSGPAYIKLGQFISHRKDIFGAEMSTALSGLKDKVKPVPWEIIEREIPMDPFEYIDPIPIATASIAQVHRATLKDSGKMVAIKIKKPKVDEDFEREMAELRMLQVFVPSLKKVLIDFERSIEHELDFKKEVSNIKRFYDMYSFSNQVTVPRVYSNLCTSNMIVMQFVPSDTIQPDTRILIRLFINQLLFESIIHGDLHSGNIGTYNGSTVLYDFGNVIQTTVKYRRSMREFIMAVQSKDPVKTLDALIAMGIQVKNKESSLFFVSKFFEYLENLDIRTFRVNSDEIQDKIPMSLDETTTAILRSYSLLEGYCKRVDPNFSYERIIQETLEILILDTFI